MKLSFCVCHFLFARDLISTLSLIFSGWCNELFCLPLCYNWDGWVSYKFRLQCVETHVHDLTSSNGHILGPKFNQPLCNKSFYKAENISVIWNPQGTACLVSAATETDTTGKSYYGETNLYYMAVKDGVSIHVILDKAGPIYGFDWWVWCPLLYAVLVLSQSYSLCFSRCLAHKTHAPQCVGAVCDCDILSRCNRWYIYWSVLMGGESVWSSSVLLIVVPCFSPLQYCSHPQVSRRQGIWCCVWVHAR